MESYIIGLDQGTTGTTALLFDANQKIIRKSYKEHRQYFPDEAWVEHDAEEIFANAVWVIKNLVQTANIQFNQIMGIGITNQRETSVGWDRRTSKPISRAIVWQCRRTANVCEQMKKKPRLARTIQQTTGLTIDPYFSATKFAWLINNATINQEHIALGTIDSWLIWKFTGGKKHVTDVTNASRTMLFDIQRQTWSPELCRIFGVPLASLPKTQPSIGEFGRIDRDFFEHEIPILAVIGDQQAALFGHGAVKPFQAKCTFGTGAFALVHCGKKFRTSRHKLLTTLACANTRSAQYALEGSVFMAGSIIQWLRDELKIIDDPSQMDGLAAAAASNDGVYLVPAFAGLGAPYWKPNVRAVLSGMHLGTSRAHIARACLEAVAYQVYDLLQAIEKDIGKKITDLHVDGGLTNSDFLMQFLADILQIPIHKSSMVEMTGFGAAKAAAESIQFWENHNQNLTVVFSPKLKLADIKPLLHGWRKAIRQALLSSH